MHMCNSSHDKHPYICIMPSKVLLHTDKGQRIMPSGAGTDDAFLSGKPCEGVRRRSASIGRCLRHAGHQGSGSKGGKADSRGQELPGPC